MCGAAEDTADTQRILAGVFGRDATDVTVAVADGHGVHVDVDRGHLRICDGVGKHRRVRRWPRVGRTLRRVVIVGHAGSVTLDALRWCADIGIPVVQLDPAGRLLSTSAYGPGGTSTDDAQLRRAQALALATDTGVCICRHLLAEKLSRSAHVAATLLHNPACAAYLRRVDLAGVDSIERFRKIEGEAAAVYFSAWAQVGMRFAGGDRLRVPAHWHRFGSRRSAVNVGRSARNASNPTNALLNYCYAVAEAECRLAVLAVGLDPGMGFLHNDYRGRDSLVFDLLEVVRPLVEEWVLTLLDRHTFTRHDFTEMRTGAVRILPPLSHHLADSCLVWARAAAPHAEQIAHLVAASSPYQIPTPTPTDRLEQPIGAAPETGRPRVFRTAGLRLSHAATWMLM